MKGELLHCNVGDSTTRFNTEEVCAPVPTSISEPIIDMLQAGWIIHGAFDNLRYCLVRAASFN